MVAARRLVGLARAGAASQPGPDGGRTDEQDEITPLDRHPDTLPRVRRAAVAIRIDLGARINRDNRGGLSVFAAGVVPATTAALRGFR
jgi:hypothetical protein